jgi:hypothetical protein
MLEQGISLASEKSLEKASTEQAIEVDEDNSRAIRRRVSFDLM